MQHYLVASQENIDSLGLYHTVRNVDGASDAGALVFVHGRCGDATLMWVFARVLRDRSLKCFAPQAPTEDPDGGYSWWVLRPEEVGTSLEDLRPGVDKLEKFFEGLPSVYGVSPERIVAVGFSQGAAMLGSLSLKRPEMFRGVALLSGYLPGVLFKEGSFVADDLQDRDLPDYFIAHGTEDGTIPFQKAEQAKVSLENLGADVEFCPDDVGHKVGASGMKALGRWFSRFSLAAK